MKNTSGPVKPTRKKAVARSSSKQQYLLLYNAVSLALWTSLLGRVLITAFAAAAGLMPSTPAGTLAGLPHIYPSVGEFVRWTQTLAVLEVLHAGLGLVNASALATGIQISGRLLQVWGINYMFGNKGLLRQSGLSGKSLGGYDEQIQANQGAYFLMLVAWSIADITRYIYFIFRIGDELTTMDIGVPKVLLWFRYNAFFVLYPIGIWSEWFLIFRSLEFAENVHPLYPRVLNSILMLYLPGAYVMYMHMVSQRNKAGQREIIKLEAEEKEKNKTKSH